MESEIASLKKNRPFKFFKKYFKEDKLKIKKLNKFNSQPVNNLVPTIKPKKAHRRPSPFQLNPEPFNKNIFSKNNFKESSSIKSL